MPLRPAAPAVQQFGPECTLDRKAVKDAVPMTSGSLRLGYLMAQRTETITSVRLSTSTTAAGATPTLVRVGVYLVDDADEGLTLVASTVNDTALFAATSTVYPRALGASFVKVAGRRYAVGVLVVTAAAAPTIWGSTSAGGSPGESSTTPRVSGALVSQTDLPASITNAALAASPILPFVALVP